MKQFKFLTITTRPLPDFGVDISELGLLRTSNMIDFLADNETIYENGEDVYMLFGKLLDNRRNLRFGDINGDTDINEHYRIISLSGRVVMQIIIHSSLDREYFTERFNDWHSRHYNNIDTGIVTWKDKLMKITASLEHYFIHAKIDEIEIEGHSVPNPFEVAHETV